MPRDQVSRKRVDLHADAADGRAPFSPNDTLEGVPFASPIHWGGGVARHSAETRDAWRHSEIVHRHLEVVTRGSHLLAAAVARSPRFVSGVHLASGRAMGRARGFAMRWIMFGVAVPAAACAATPDGLADGAAATPVVVDDLSGFDVLMGVCAELRVAAAEAKCNEKQKPGASLCEYAATQARGCYPQATRLFLCDVRFGATLCDESGEPTLLRAARCQRRLTEFWACSGW